MEDSAAEDSATEDSVSAEELLPVSPEQEARETHKAAARNAARIFFSFIFKPILYCNIHLL